MLNVGSVENGGNQLVIPDYHLDGNTYCSKDIDYRPYLGTAQTKVEFMRKISETDNHLHMRGGANAGLTAILEKDECAQQQQRASVGASGGTK